jgi:hypothetical protein
MRIPIDFGEPTPDHKLVARLLKHEHPEAAFPIFSDEDYKKAIGLIVRSRLAEAVIDQKERDAEAEFIRSHQ